MKQIIYTTAFLLLAMIHARGQNITITMNSKGKMEVAGNGSSATHQSPFRLVFSKDFNSKKISFYKTKNNNSQFITDAVFGSDIGKEGDQDVFPVYIKNHIVDVKGNTTATDTFYFKIEGDAFSKPVIITKDTAEKKDNIATYIQGSAIYDALLLAKEKNKLHPGDDPGTIKNILQRYGITDNNGLMTNEFLESELGGIYDPLLVDTSFGGTAAIHSSGLPTAIGGLDVTNIADGFARFIVKRTKEELSIAYFERFKKELEQYPDLQDVFPATYKLLYAIDQEIYDYEKYISNLREAFRTDLQSIDEHLPAIVDNHREFFSKTGKFELGLALRSGCYMTMALKQQVHPGDMLEQYPLSFFDDAPGADKAKLQVLKGSIQLVQLISSSLRQPDGTITYWAEKKTISELANNQTALKIYFGLLLQMAAQQYENIPFSDQADFYHSMNTPAIVQAFDHDYKTYKQYINNFGNRLNELNKMVTEYERPASDSAKAEQYTRYFKTSVQLIDYCTQAAQLPHIKDITGISKLAEKSKSYFGIAYEAADLSSAIIRKKYAAAINHLLNMYTIVLVDPTVQSSSEAASLKLSRKQKLEIAGNVVDAYSSDPNTTAAIIVTKDPQIAAAIRNKDTTAQNSKTTLAAIAKYGAFMTSLVDANDSKEVAAAIEAAALPAGSARIKRQTRTNVSINAYCGFFAGNEVIKGFDADKPFSRINSYGLTAPVGIAISKGNRLLPWPLSQLFNLKGVSTSWFISLVDLGAVAAFRFTDDETAQVPSIQLKDIFSPGIFWSVGIPRSPLSVNLGAQVGPNLRKVTATANDYSDKMYIRYSVSFCVDLPLLNITNKP